MHAEAKTKSSPTALVLSCEKASASTHDSDGKWRLGPEQAELGLDPGEL